MIYPNDQKYHADAKQANDTRPVITSYKEYMDKAISNAFSEYVELNKDIFEQNAQDRYRDNQELGLINSRTYSNNIVDCAKQITGVLELQNRLDEYIRITRDDWQKTMAMAVRRVTEPMLNKFAEDFLFNACYDAMDDVTRDFIISPEVMKILDDKKQDIEKSEEGKIVNNRPVDINNCNFEDLPSLEQYNIISGVVRAFFDKDALKTPTGETIPETPAASELLWTIKEEALDICNAVISSSSRIFGAKNDREKRDFNDLVQIYKKASEHNKKEESAYQFAVEGTKSYDQYANNLLVDTNLIDNLNLVLENNPVVDLTAEKYLEKHQNGQLSAAETEWAEASVDSMLRSLYSDDELRALRRAGMDPAMGILVDGKPLKWFSDKENIFNMNDAKSRFSITAKRKSDVVSKALNGSKIDVFKFIPDGEGGYKKEKIVPIKTDFSMKTEKRSFFTWLLEFLGITPSIKSKIKEANEDKREYHKNFGATSEELAEMPQDAAEIVKQSNRDEVATIMKVNAVNEAKQKKQLYLDFFGHLQPANTDENNGKSIVAKISDELNKTLSFKDQNGKERQLLDITDRYPSHVNLAIIYGLANGHTLEEITENSPQGTQLRQELGRRFIEDFSVMDFDEFVREEEKEKAFNSDSEAKKAYFEYVFKRKENVEKVAIKAFEAIGRMPIMRLDPNNQTEFAKNYAKYDQITNIMQDFSQAFVTLYKNSIAPTDERAKLLTNRGDTVYNYINSKIFPFKQTAACVLNYANFLSGDDFVGTGAPQFDIFVNQAAMGKTALEYFNEKTQGMNTYNDLFDNEEVNAKISAVSTVLYNTDMDEERANHYIDRLRENNTLDMDVHEEIGYIYNYNERLKFSEIQKDKKEKYSQNMEKMSAYVDLDNIKENNELLSDKFEEAIDIQRDFLYNTPVFKEHLDRADFMNENRAWRKEAAVEAKKFARERGKKEGVRKAGFEAAKEAAAKAQKLAEERADAKEKAISFKEMENMEKGSEKKELVKKESEKKPHELTPGMGGKS